MNHQPFRDWLLSDEKLSPDQTQALQEHLESCTSCDELATAWSEVESSLQHAPLLIPAPGFTTRWQAHLDGYLLHKQKQRVGISIGITVIFILSLLIILISQLWSFVQSPEQYLAIWFNSLVSLVSIYYALVEKIPSFSEFTPVYTLVGLFFLAGIVSFMSVLWLATYRKVSMVRRMI